MRVWDPLVGSKGALALNKLLDKVINIQYIRGLAGFHRSRTIKPTSFYTPYRFFCKLNVAMRLSGVLYLANSTCFSGNRPQCGNDENV